MAAYTPYSAYGGADKARQAQAPSGMDAGKILVVGVLAALVFGQIANPFQFREFIQQLFLDPSFSVTSTIEQPLQPPPNCRIA